MRLNSLTGISAILLFSLAGIVAAAYATPITYTVSAIGTGSLGASNFTDKLVTVTLSADTSTVTGSGLFFTNTGPAQVNVSGIGTATFTDNIIVFSNHVGGPGSTGAAGIETARFR